MKLREDGYVNTIGTGLGVSGTGLGVGGDEKIDICFLSAESLVDWMNECPKETIEIALMKALGHSVDVWALKKIK